MKDYFKIIKALTPEEFSLFGKFLNSPLHNSSDRQVKFYNFIKMNSNRFSETGLSKEVIKKQFFSAKTLEEDSRAEVNSRKLISEFMKLFENFLSYLEFERKVGYKKILLLHTLRKRRLNDLFESCLSEIQEELSKKPFNDRYYIRKKLMEEAKIYQLSTDYHSSAKFIQKESDALDMYFVSEKLELFQNMFSMEYINKETKLDWKYYDEIMKYVEKDIAGIQKEEPVIFFNIAMLKLVKDPGNQALFDELRNFVVNNSNRIQPGLLKDMAFDLINFCYIKARSDNNKFRLEMHSLFEFLDNRDLIALNGVIKYSNYKNAVDNASSLRKFDWLEKFIHKYADLIEDKYRENIKNLSLTKLYFFNGEFDKARSYQQKIDYKDFVHYFDAKLVLSCIEYEEGNDDAVFLILDSLKKYFKKHGSLPETYTDSYKKFITSLPRLIRCRENISLGESADYELEILRDEIEQINFYRKMWLLEKIDVLKCKNKKAGPKLRLN